MTAIGIDPDSKGFRLRPGEGVGTAQDEGIHGDGGGSGEAS